jgi:hypothetical protein
MWVLGKKIYIRLIYSNQKIILIIYKICKHINLKDSMIKIIIIPSFRYLFSALKTLIFLLKMIFIKLLCLAQKSQLIIW